METNINYHCVDHFYIFTIESNLSGEAQTYKAATVLKTSEVIKLKGYACNVQIPEYPQKQQSWRRLVLVDARHIIAALPF